MTATLDQTKARLLEAAGREFADKGFEGATVRSICDRAGANLAAVNYHFGDKERLYAEAVMEAHRCGTRQMPDAMLDLAPAEALRRYIHHFLTNVAALKQETWHHTLMLREMTRPTRASVILVEEAIRPRFVRLAAIFRRICPDADDRRIHALAFSVVGQCLHYKVSRDISEQIVGPEAFARLDLEYLADHVAHLTLAALGQAPPLGAARESTEGEPSLSAERGR